MKKNAEAQVFRLWKAYQDIKIHTASAKSLISATGFIISACNPRSQLCEQSFNRRKTQKLQRYLESNHIEFKLLLVGDVTFSWSEPSFLIFATESQARNLARIYQQNAVYQLKQGELWLVPVLLGQVTPTSMGPVSTFISGNS
ncbi:DUF3293 domain-containing protein [Planctobacterium marinum]|uniref:DUF3293 domain-containing protein n=1 Tax=Planctobacterium marinum TaxID=1631968 RepID=UPI0030C71B38